MTLPNGNFGQNKRLQGWVQNDVPSSVSNAVEQEIVVPLENFRDDVDWFLSLGKSKPGERIEPVKHEAKDLLEQSTDFVVHGSVSAVTYSLMGMATQTVSRRVGNYYKLGAGAMKVIDSPIFGQTVGAGIHDFYLNAPDMKGRVANALGGATTMASYEGANHLLPGKYRFAKAVAQPLIGAGSAVNGYCVSTVADGGQVKENEMLHAAGQGAAFGAVFPAAAWGLGKLRLKVEPGTKATTPKEHVPNKTKPTAKGQGNEPAKPVGDSHKSEAKVTGDGRVLLKINVTKSVDVPMPKSGEKIGQSMTSSKLVASTSAEFKTIEPRLADPVKATESKGAEPKQSELAKVVEAKDAKTKHYESAKVVEVKEAEAKPLESAKVVEVKEAEAKPLESAKVVEVKEAEAKASEPAKVVEVKEAEAKASEPAKVVEAKEAEAKPLESAKVVEAKEAEAKPSEPAKVVEAKEAEAKALESAKVVEIKEAEAKPLESAKVVEVKEAEAKALESAKVVEAKETEAKPLEPATKLSEVSESVESAAAIETKVVEAGAIDAGAIEVKALEAYAIDAFDAKFGSTFEARIESKYGQVTCYALPFNIAGASILAAHNASTVTTKDDDATADSTIEGPSVLPVRINLEEERSSEKFQRQLPDWMDEIGFRVGLFSPHSQIYETTYSPFQQTIRKIRFSPPELANSKFTRIVAPSFSQTLRAIDRGHALRAPHNGVPAILGGFDADTLSRYQDVMGSIPEFSGLHNNKYDLLKRYPFLTKDSRRHSALSYAVEDVGNAQVGMLFSGGVSPTPDPTVDPAAFASVLTPTTSTKQ